MPDSTTTHYGWTLPTNNADDDTWGTLLNANWTALDGQLFTVAGLAGAAMPSGGGTFTGSISGTSGGFSGTVTAAGFSGPLAGAVTGNVTGNLLGNVTGNVAGNVTGALTGNASTATALAAAATLSYTGDATGSLSFSGASASAALTLATVNANVGSIGSASAVPVLTLDAKGRVTAASTASLSGYAPLLSPTFTGTPAAPTATAGTNTTQLATTAFATAAAAAIISTNLATPGHIKVGGFVLNWGTFSLGGAGGATQNVTFDLAFPTGFLLGWCGVDNAAVQMIGVTAGSGTTTGMQVQKGAGDTNSRTGPWFAIGY